MAIVFVSPKKRQRTFWLSLIGFFVLVIAVIVAAAFLPEIQNRFSQVSMEQVFEIPEVKINFSAIDSFQVKRLQSFNGVVLEFSYTGQNSVGRQVTGTISALSQGEAVTELAKQGLSALTVKPVPVGRSNPFVPY